MLERHDQLLDELMDGMPARLQETPHSLIDALFDTYLRLYREEPGFLALRHSTLFEQHHRRWTADRIERLVRRVVSAAVEAGVVTPREDLIGRTDLVVGVGEGILQAVFLRDPDGDPVVIAEGREIDPALRGQPNRLSTARQSSHGMATVTSKPRWSLPGVSKSFTSVGTTPFTSA